MKRILLGILLLCLPNLLFAQVYESPDQKVTVQISPESFYGLKAESQQEFAQEVLDIVSQLMDSKDPRVNIVIESDFRSTKVEGYISTEADKRTLPSHDLGAPKKNYHGLDAQIFHGLKPGINLFIPIGYFAVAKDYNELGGLLAYQLATTRARYNEAIRSVISFVSTDGDLTFKDRMSRVISADSISLTEDYKEFHRNLQNSLSGEALESYKAHKRPAEDLSHYLSQILQKNANGKALSVFEIQDFNFLMGKILRAEIAAVESVKESKDPDSRRPEKVEVSAYEKSIRSMNTYQLDGEMRRASGLLKANDALSEMLRYREVFETQDTDFKDVLKKIDHHTDRNPYVKERLFAAYSAIHRMIGKKENFGGNVTSRGGFDPWGIITPTEKMSEGGGDSFLRDLKEKKESGKSKEDVAKEIKARRKMRSETAAMELEFMSQYLTWLGNQHLSSSTQRHYQKPLTQIQRKVRDRAWLVQGLTFGPVRAEYSAVGSALAVFYIFGESLSQSSESVFNKIGKVFSPSTWSRTAEGVSTSTSETVRNAGEISSRIANRSGEASSGVFARVGEIWNSFWASGAESRGRTAENLQNLKDKVGTQISDSASGAKQNVGELWSHTAGTREAVGDFFRWGVDGVSKGFGHAADGIGWTFGKGRDGVVGSYRMIDTYLLNPIGDVAGKSWSMGSEVVRTGWGYVDTPFVFGFEHYRQLTNYMGPVETATYLAPFYATYKMGQYLLRSNAIKSGNYFSRYRRNIKDQIDFTRSLSQWKSGGQDIEALVEMSRTQNNIMSFISDSLSGDFNRYQARVLYMHLYKPELIFFLSNKKFKEHREFREYAKENWALLQGEVEEKVEKIWEQKYKNKYGSPEEIRTRNQSLRNASREDSVERLKNKIRMKVFREMIREKFYHQMVYKGQLPQVIHPGDFETAVDKVASGASQRSRTLTRLFGLPAYFSASFNMTYLLRQIELQLNRKGLSSENRVKLTNALLELNIIDHINPRTRKRYLSILGRHVPELKNLQAKETRALLEDYRAGRLSEKIYTQALLHLSRTKVSSPDVAVDVLSELISKDKIRQAYGFTFKNYRFLVQSEDSQLASLFEKMMSDFGAQHGIFWVRSWLKHRLYLKVVLSSPPQYRVALLSSIKKALMRQPFLAKTKIGKIVYSMSAGHLRSVKTLGQSLNHFDRLAVLGMTSSDISEIFIQSIELHPERITSMEQIHRVLKSPHLFKGFQDVSVSSLSNWEKKIYDKYTELAKKYESFTFDPVTSEKIQKALLERFRALQKDASLNEKFEFWRLLAKKGTTGFSDGFFAELMSEDMPSSERKKWSEVAVNEHLVWDKNIRASLYLQLVEKDYSPEKLDSSSKEAVVDLEKRIRAYAQGQISFEEFKAFLQETFIAQTPEQKQIIEDLLSKDIKGKVAYQISRGPKAPAAHPHRSSLKQPVRRQHEKRRDLRARYKAPTRAELKSNRGNMEAWQARRKKADLEQRLTQVLRDQKVEFDLMGRLGVIQEGIRQLSTAFPDGGATLRGLLNSMSEGYQTRQHEAQFVKETFTDILKNQESDLAYSVINDLVNMVKGLSKADRWEFILWLRGKVPPPSVVRQGLQVMGPETVRRLFSTQPIEVKEVFISTLINTETRSGVVNAIKGQQSNPLLSGIDAKVYRELILNELLPQEKTSAQVARDFLEAYLTVTSKAHQRKSNIILAFLLANQSEGQANVGSVVRNILEYYGVIGIKLGQFMANDERLPQEITEELKKLRDQALKPMRDAIFTSLTKILKTQNIGNHFEVKGLLGAASVKYAILVEDKAGNQHVLQIKRNEALGPLADKFKELQEIVDILAKKNPKRYAFLQGIVNSVVSAIIREISLPMESVKTVQAREQYNRIFKNTPVAELRVPTETDLLEQFKGAEADVKERVRSSEFVPGTVIDDFKMTDQKIFARQILSIETERFYGEFVEGVCKSFCSDRHPGNVLLSIEGKKYMYFPIDFGQELVFTEPMRKSLHKIMAASQVLEAVGTLPSVVEKIKSEFNLDVPTKELTKELNRFFPNTSGMPRSAIGPYYDLLGSLDKFGFPVHIFFYEFLKGIHQLEAYERLIVEEGRPSPRKLLSQFVNESLQTWQKDLARVGFSEKLRFAVTRPLAARVAADNARLAADGTLVVKNFLQFLEIDFKKLHTMSAEFENMKTGEDFLQRVKAVSEHRSFSEKEKEKLKLWSAHPQVQSLIAESLSVDEFVRLTTRSGITADIVTAKVRASPKILQLPYVAPIGKMFSSIYVAEVLNAIFWSFWDHNPQQAIEWLQHFMTSSKHAGLATFAMASGFYKHYSQKLIPVSMKSTRWVSEHGIGMTIGMLVGDLTSRMVGGQSWSEARQAVFSEKMMREYAFVTVAFMAAEATLNRGLAGVRYLDWTKKTHQYKDCQGWIAGTVRMGALFIGAHAYERLTRDYVTEIGILSKETVLHITGMPKASGVITASESLREEFVKFAETSRHLEASRLKKAIEKVQKGSDLRVLLDHMVASDAMLHGDRMHGQEWDDQASGLLPMGVQWMPIAPGGKYERHDYCRFETYESILKDKNYGDLEAGSFFHKYLKIKSDLGKLQFNSNDPEATETASNVLDQLNLNNLIGPMPHNVCNLNHGLRRMSAEAQ